LFSRALEAAVVSAAGSADAVAMAAAQLIYRSTPSDYSP
jgi:hypothetical protein